MRLAALIIDSCEKSLCLQQLFANHHPVPDLLCESHPKSILFGATQSHSESSVFVPNHSTKCIVHYSPLQTNNKKKRKDVHVFYVQKLPTVFGMPIPKVSKIRSFKHLSMSLRTEFGEVIVCTSTCRHHLPIPPCGESI